MKSMSGGLLALVWGAILSAGMSTASAQDGCPGCDGMAPSAATKTERDPAPGTQDIQDGDDEDALFAQLEKNLNEVLVVEESGRIVLREEFAAGLPFPAERVQAMLGSFVELGPDGKIRVRDRDAVRPYMPMLRRFLSPESLARLREVQKLPPEERRAALQRMFGQGGGAPTPEARPSTPAPTPTPRPSRPTEETRPAQRPGRGEQPVAGVEQRLSRLEEQLARIERMLGSRQGGEGELHGRSGGDERLHRDGERRGGLGDLFGRGRDGQEGIGSIMERARVWERGLRKLSEIMTPEDVQVLVRAIDKLRKDMKPGDLRDQGALMEKLQGAIDPADLGRFMEIFSQFIATDEGRELAAEVEDTVARLEKLVNSPEGERMGDALEKLGERFGNGGGEGEGRGVREQLERLMRGRDREDRAQPQRQAEPRRERGQPERPRGIPERARLY